MGYSAYRADIDGLRAVAVIAVVLYHAGVPGVSGGFVGVDVFFVISGFLITALLIAEHERSGLIALGAFWARRVRRIVPALAVVLATVMVVGATVLLPWDYTSMLHSARAAALSIANLHFWQQSGDYFSPGIEGEPLLHLWSLGVEEQFYLVLPVIVAVAAKVGGRRAVGWTIGALGITSLAWSIVSAGADGRSSFYLPHLRAWELLAGSGLAICAPRLTVLGVRVAEVLGSLGVVLIVASTLAYSDGITFPGVAALLPVAGASAVIAAGCAGHRARGLVGLLHRRPALWIGRWSYSWYLWHWPALIAVRELSPVTSVGRDVAVCIGALAMAAVTWRLVEEPCRRGLVNRGVPSPAVVIGAGAIVLVAVALSTTVLIESRGAAVTETSVAASSLPSPSAASTTSSPSASAPGAPSTSPPPWPPDVDWRAQSMRGILEASRRLEPVQCAGYDGATPFGSPVCAVREGYPSVVVFGDSHSAHLVPAAAEVAASQGWGLRHASRAACPPVSGVVVVEAGGIAFADCADWVESVLEELVADPARVAVVVLSARSGLYLPGETIASAFMQMGLQGQATPEDAALLWAASLEATVSRLTAAGIAVVWVHDVPELEESPSDCLARQAVASCSIDAGRAAAYRFPMAAAELDALGGMAGAALLDPFKVLCSDSVCRVVRGTEVLYADDNHLSPAGALLLVPALDEAIRTARSTLS